MGACHIKILKIGNFCFTESEDYKEVRTISVRGALSLLWKALVPLHEAI